LVVLQDPDLIAQELHVRAMLKPVMEPKEAVASGRRDGTPILKQVTKAKHQAETEAILAALNSTRWNRKQAAVLLKIDYKALLYKMKKLGIEDDVVSFDAEADEEPPKAVAAEYGR
jgi:DNA-binding NtrC family response regulator